MTALPIVNYLQIDGDLARLTGQECIGCGAIFIGRRNGCAQCAGSEFRDRVLSHTGAIRSFTIICRAPEGIPTPYIVVVVDHDGGGTVKANLLGVEADPAQVSVGAAVKVVAFAAGNDSRGNTAMGFGYELI